MSRGAIALAVGLSIHAIIQIDGRLLDTDFLSSILPGWLAVIIFAGATLSILYGLYQLTFKERNRFAIGGIAALAAAGVVVFLSQSDTGPTLSLLQSEEERSFQDACEKAGNTDEACDCAWEGFETEFSGLHLKVLVASLAKDQALVRSLMSDPDFDHGTYFGSVLKRTPAIERRCRVAF